MRILIQRVSRATVSVGAEVVGQIADGLVCFLGVRQGDTEAELKWLVDKVCQLRIFQDADGKMNRSVEDTKGSVLIVSQFTLYGDAQKGNRPSFILAARPEEANRLYEASLTLFRERLGRDRVASGVFQAMMEVDLVNSGPVTILLEKEKV